VFSRLNYNYHLDALAAFSVMKHGITSISSRQHVSHNQHRFLDALF